MQLVVVLLVTGVMGAAALDSDVVLESVVVEAVVVLDSVVLDPDVSLKSVRLRLAGQPCGARLRREVHHGPA